MWSCVTRWAVRWWRFAAGYRFEGDGTRRTATQQLSSSTTYLYTPPHRTMRRIFPKLRPTQPLDDEGTANCYIAPALNTSYSFDARRGQRRCTTLNVTPKRLSGVSARILWETGTLSEAIVKDMRYQDGRITFTTGTTHGNAVIGLSTAVGNASGRGISGRRTTIRRPRHRPGAVFMDRNLGALEADYTLPASRGL